jgi:hypothetical protein
MSYISAFAAGIGVMPPSIFSHNQIPTNDNNLKELKEFRLQGVYLRTKLLIDNQLFSILDFWHHSIQKLRIQIADQVTESNQTCKLAYRDRMIQLITTANKFIDELN